MMSRNRVSRALFLSAAAALIHHAPARATPPDPAANIVAAPAPAASTLPASRSSGPESGRAARPLPLQVMVANANTDLRKPAGEDFTGPDLVTRMQGTTLVKVRDPRITPNNDGSWTVTSTAIVNRGVTYDTSADQAKISRLSSDLRIASANAEKSHRDFKKKWTPKTKSKGKGATIVWNCPTNRCNDRQISDAEHSRRLADIVSRGKSQIESARASLESAKSQSAERRETALARARTVDLTITLPDNAPELESLRAGREVALHLEVREVTIASDPPEIRQGGRHVRAVQLAPPPTVIASLSP